MGCTNRERKLMVDKLIKSLEKKRNAKMQEKAKKLVNQIVLGRETRTDILSLDGKKYEHNKEM